MYFLNVVKANIKMQYRDYFFNKTIYMSLLVWPMIMFVNAYYSYKPFSEKVLYEKFGVRSSEQVYIYLFVGFVAMMFFWSLVQSAWQTSYRMRLSGTLELLYLSPANRIGVLLGNSIASLIGSIWMLIVFAISMFVAYYEKLQLHMGSTIISLLILIALALSWGIFLNSLFLLTRDSGFLYTILESPMEIFSGVKLPFHMMPLWAQAIGIIFPLTYIIRVLRLAVLKGYSPKQLIMPWLICIGLMVLLSALSYGFIVLGEKQGKRTGSSTLF